jgi:hypothetical protein
MKPGQVNKKLKKLIHVDFSVFQPDDRQNKKK